MNRFKILWLLSVLALAGMMVVGCSDSGTSPGRNNGGTLPRENSVGKTEDGYDVLVFDEGELDNILFQVDSISYSDEEGFVGTLLFRGLEKSRMPVAGDIINSAGSEIAEYGFLYKVLDVSTQGDITAVTVREAALDEAIEDEEFDSETDLEFDEDGNLIGMQQKTVTKGISVTQRIPITGLNNVNGEVTAAIAYTMKLRFKVSIKKWRLQSAELSLSQDMDVTLNGVIEGSIDGSKMYRITSQSLPKIKFWVGLVHVVINNSIDVDLKLSGSAEAGMKVSYTLNGKTKNGVGYTRGRGVHKIDEKSFSREFTFEQYMAGRVRVSAIVSLTSRLWGTVGLSVGAGPGLEMSVKGSPTGIHVYDRGFRYDYRGYTSIWDNMIDQDELGEAAWNDNVNKTLDLAGATGESNRDRPIENEARLDFGIEFSARIVLRILGKSLLNYEFANDFYRIGQPLYRTSFLPLFDDPRIVENADGMEIRSRIERDLLNFPVSDFGICLESAGTEECKAGNGVRRTFGSVRAGQRRSFTAAFDNLTSGTVYGIRPFFSTGVGMFYDMATLYEFTGDPTTYTLTATAAEGGTVSRDPDQANYLPGTAVTVTAVPAEGYAFTEWSGASVSTDASVTITMNDDMTLTANFRQLPIYIDPRDQQVYNTISIGNRTWMTRNLNYATGNMAIADTSLCYNNSSVNCVAYGRLYNWEQAMEACPAVDGWRLPTRTDWNSLVQAAGGVDVAGRRLKSRIGWSRNGNGTDDYDFTALPGGIYAGAEGPEYSNMGEAGYWWSAAEYSSSWGAYYRAINYTASYVGTEMYEDFDIKESAMSVRCVRN